MTIPFICVFIAFALVYLSKAPVALAMAKEPGGYDNSDPRGQQAGLTGWARRAVASHQNGFEAFPAFAAAVLIAHLGGADPTWAARLSIAFVTARALYIPLYILDLHSLRSTVWGVGFLATVGLFLLPILT
jgi:uncharacterized MAPEG superfamily protein